jgi:hypothetical protein
MTGDEQMGYLSSWCLREPTLSEMLSDPIVRALMKADGVERAELEAMLQNVAAQSFPGQGVTRSVTPPTRDRLTL